MADDNSQGTDTPAAQETVQVEKATEAELDSFLDANLDSEDEGETEEETGEEVESSDEDDAEEASEGLLDEDAEDSDEETEDTEEADPTPAPATETIKAENERLAAHNAEMATQLERKELYIQHKLNEIGELRKNNRELQAALERDLSEKADLNPLEAFNDAQKIKELKGQEQALQQEETTLTNRRTVDKHIAPILYEGLLEDMKTVLIHEDQIDPQTAARIIENPYSVHPGVIINLAKRTRARREAYAMSIRIRELEGSNAKRRPEAVLKKVAKASRQVPQITGKTPSRSTSGKAPLSSRKEIANLTDAQLDAQMKKLGI